MSQEAPGFGREGVRAGPILEALSEGPLSGRDLARLLGGRWSDVFRTLRVLAAEGVLVREGRGRSARLRLAGRRPTAG